MALRAGADADCSGLHHIHVLRHDKGRDDVEQNACASQAEGRPDQANDGGIDAEVLGKTCADTADHSVVAFIQFLHQKFLRFIDIG